MGEGMEGRQPTHEVPPSLRLRIVGHALHVFLKVLAEVLHVGNQDGFRKERRYVVEVNRVVCPARAREGKVSISARPHLTRATPSNLLLPRSTEQGRGQNRERTKDVSPSECGQHAREDVLVVLLVLGEPGPVERNELRDALALGRQGDVWVADGEGAERGHLARLVEEVCVCCEGR
jgi:hypothetical protein